jgi:hypothetical protein
LVHVGCGAGFSGDRCDAGLPVIQTLSRLGGPAYLNYETLAERTLALAQLDRRRDPGAGYEPYLCEFLRPVLRHCVERGVRVVANFGPPTPLQRGSGSWHWPASWAWPRSASLW